ncbi:MAG: hypothetical protein NT167_28440 [Verrucomicrobia bacterium]|nr:hypothetical protein [Verrucomicrobiota bacterium]
MTTESVALTLSPPPAVANASHRDAFEKDTMIVATSEVQLVRVPKLRHGGDSDKAAQLEHYICEAERGMRSILQAGFFIECLAEDLPHGQLGPWVEAHCPNRKWRTVQRWKQVAAKLADDIGISYQGRVGMKLYDVLALPLGEVSDQLRPIREKIDAEIAGKSFRQLFLEFKQSEDGVTPKRGRIKCQGGASKLQREASQQPEEGGRLEAMAIRRAEVTGWLNEVSDDKHLGMLAADADFLAALELCAGYLRRLAGKTSAT